MNTKNQSSARTTFAASAAILALLTTGALLPFTTHAAAPEKVSAFVCPVITAEAVGEHNPVASPLRETATIP